METCRWLEPQRRFQDNTLVIFDYREGSHIKRQSSFAGEIALPGGKRDNEDEDDNSESYDLSDEEETPQAGDVIRYNGRKRSPRGMDHKSSDGGEEEEENDWKRLWIFCPFITVQLDFLLPFIPTIGRFEVVRSA